MTVGRSLSWVLCVGLGLGLSACGRPLVGQQGDTTTTGGSDTEADGSTATSESSEDEGSETEDTEDTEEPKEDAGSSWIIHGDVMIEPCDPFTQDCPEGEKCVPGNTAPSTNVCVPVMGDREPGESCESFENSPDDDCDGQGWCLYGTCQPFCSGSEDLPVCDEGFECLIEYDGTWTICLPGCDPLAPICAEGETCAHSQNMGDHIFICIEAWEPGDLGESCWSSNSCTIGNVCGAGEYLPECDDPACCTEYCDLSDPDPMCTLMGTSCTSIWLENEVPEGLEDIGMCIDYMP